MPVGPSDTALSSKPAGETHWSVRSLAEATHLSKSSVQRYLHLFGVQPHRTTSFKLSNDPFFIEKLRDIVGLYLNPPEDALVLLSHTAKNHIRLNQSHPETIFRVRMDGLKPSTTYYYKVTSMGYDGVSDGVESSVQQIATSCPRSANQRFPAA